MRHIAIDVCTLAMAGFSVITAGAAIAPSFNRVRRELLPAALSGLSSALSVIRSSRDSPRHTSPGHVHFMKQGPYHKRYSNPLKPYRQNFAAEL